MIVNDCPKQWDKSGQKHQHSVFVLEHNLETPFTLNGMMSGFPTSLATEEVLRDCIQIELTSDLRWDPNANDFAKKEAAMSDISGVNSMPVLDDSRTISALVSNN